MEIFKNLFFILKIHNGFASHTFFFFFGVLKFKHKLSWLTKNNSVVGQGLEKKQKLLTYLEILLQE